MNATFSPAQQMQMALHFHAKGELDKARVHYQSLLERFPLEFALLYNFGLLESQAGQQRAAVALFERAAQVDPGSADAWNNLAYCRQQLGQHTEALADYERALERAPQDGDVLRNLGRLLQRLGRSQEALPLIDRLLQLLPRDVPGWMERGRILKTLGQRAEAVACFDQVLAIDPLLPQAHAHRAALLLSDAADAGPLIEIAQTSLRVYLQHTFATPGPEAPPPALGFSKLKHDWQQACFLRDHDQPVPGLLPFIDAAAELLQQAGAASHTLPVSPRLWAQMTPYLATPWLFPMPVLAHCLNPELDWRELQERYLAGRPEILCIDGFLAPEALKAFQDYSRHARVWHTEYANSYLGAFAQQGFISPLHLQLARELRQAMPRVLLDHSLNQLWGFKYEPTVTTGINIHADFAKVNLNFWIAPDAANLDASSGGLKLFDVPAPADWSFAQYNTDKARIHEFLRARGATARTVAHRCNRAVLFNSALFHETDSIRFTDSYEGRRVNMTYLFGTQLQ